MPVPALLALGLQYAPKIIGGIQEKKRLEQDFEREKKTLSRLGAQEQAQLQKRQYGVGDAWNQYLAASKQDKAADLQRQIASEQEASAIGALKAGGAKALLGGLGAAQRQAAQQRMGIEAESQARQQAALQQYAGVQQRAADMNVGLAAEDLERTRGLKDEATLRKELLRGEKRAAKSERTQNILQGITDVAQLAFGTAKDGKKVEMDDLYKDISQSISEEKAKPRYTSVYGSRAGSYKTTVQDRMGSGVATQDDLISALTGTEEEDTSAAGISRASRKNALETVLGEGYQLGDLTRNSEYGGRYASGGVQKTPGEFSHAKNPIDIMKDGAKIGEMTGGEYIFNPRQASTLQSLASKGGSPLHKYVRNLLKEFDKR
jgi:hypothetical protein